jgi:hypothetical protein
VRRFLVKEIEPFLRIGSLNDFIRRLEHGLQGGSDTGFVIDEEDALLRAGFAAVL